MCMSKMYREKKILANRSEYELWGFKNEDEIIGKTDADLIAEGSAILAQNEDRHVIETGEPILKKDAYTQINGEEYVLLVSKIPLRDTNNDIIGLVGISSDITERRKLIDKLRKQNVQLKQLNETTSKIYSVIGHDLKTPLSSILGIADLMLDEIRDSNEISPLGENLKIIHQASLKMSDLLKDLLSWARIQSGELKLNKEKFLINETIENTIDLLDIAADQKGITIDFKSNGPLTVYADEQLIATIIRNFISNALKFSNQDDTITIELDWNSDQWQISVSDEGVGMSKATQEKLFDDEEHPSQHGTNDEKGSGIGLRLCKNLATMHGGNIEVESEPGQGSTFTLILPRVDTT